MRLLKSLALAVSLAFFFILHVAAASAQIHANAKTFTMQMPLVAPLFIEDGDFTSTLVLVNGAAAQTYADVTVRALDGKTVATRRVHFEPHSQQQVDIRALLDSAGASSTTNGSITVLQSPALSGIAISAALSMTRLSSSAPNYIDQELAMPTAESSQILRAVTDRTESSPILAITSLSNIGQHVQVQCLVKIGAGSSKTVELSAGETLLTEACSEETVHGADFQRYAEDSRNEVHGPIGVALRSDAMPGSFAAFALAPHGTSDHRYFSSLAFIDPKMVMSTTTVFTGVPVGSAIKLPAGTYTPTVALANFANRDAQVTVRYAQTSGDTPHTRNLQSVTVPAQSSKEISLTGLTGDPNLQNSFLIVANGAPGDVAAKVVARSDAELREVELLGKDLKDPENSGNHPWSIENGTDSTLLLFNTSTVPQYFNVAIAAGSTVWRKVYQLQPMQTKAVSILDLITRKVKDDKGKMLPKDIWHGQVAWYLPGPNGGRGRILQSNRQRAMARNFSCGTYSSICGGTWDPYTTTFVTGQTSALGDLEANVCLGSMPGQCSGTYVGTGNDYNYIWSSGNSNVAALSGPTDGNVVNVKGIALGSTSIYGEVFDEYGCNYSPSVPVTVKGCPSTLTRVSSLPQPLAPYVPKYLTGIGIIAEMQVGPSGTNANGVQITESVSQLSNTCPANFGAQCTGSDTFTVGTNDNGNDTVDGASTRAIQNVFYDNHVVYGPSNYLAAAGITSCASTCQQVYTCGGHQVGPTFTITRSYTKGTVGSTAVTNVTTTKTP
jgi:hypothetical protein